MRRGAFHLEARCPTCDRWLKWLPQIEPWLTLAPARPDEPGRPWYAYVLPHAAAASIPESVRPHLDQMKCVICRRTLEPGATLGVFLLSDDFAAYCGRAPGATTLYGFCPSHSEEDAARAAEARVLSRGEAAAELVKRAN